MPLFQNHVGINLTETKLQLVEISYKQNNFYLENVDQLVFKEPVLPDVQDQKLINILQDSLAKIILKKTITSNSISFTLPNNFFRVFEVPYDNALTKKDLVEQLRWEISILFPMYDCNDFYIQYVEVNKSSFRSEDKLIVFALSKRIVGAINKFCKENKFELKFVDNAHLASNAFLYLDRELEREDITLSFYIDQHYSSLAVFEGLSPFYFKIFNKDGTDFFEQLEAAIEKLTTFNVNRENIKKATLSGQTVTGEFTENISKVLGLTLLKINPFEKLFAEDEVKSNPLYLSQYNSFTAATGIAIRII